MKTEYKITNADACAALKVLMREVEFLVKVDAAEEAYIAHIQRVIEALDNADRIVILP